MKVYRVGRSEYIQDLSGTGAKLYGGRWNDKGTALLYTSENISLAILEILVHFDGLTVPDDLKLLTLEIPDVEIAEYSKSKFKKTKMLSNAEYEFKSEGERWIKSKESLALRVPSIINEFESNIIINPSHRQMSWVKILRLEDLLLDERLFK
jgi:RES domain-containing protein